MCKVSCFFFSGNKYIYLVKYQLKKNELGEWLLAAPFRIEVL